MMDAKHYDEIDQLFKNRLGEQEFKPSSNLWDKIEKELPVHPTDKLFKDALTAYETEPSEKVWETVKGQLPLNLTLRTALVRLSRIAAILVMGMLTYFTLENFNWFRQPTSHEIVAQQQTVQEETLLDKKELKALEAELFADEVFETQQSAQEPSVTRRSKKSLRPIEAPIASNFPLDPAQNTIKGGGMPESLPQNANEETAVLNIDEIAKRLENGDRSRIPTNELFITEKIKKDSTLLKEPKKVIAPLKSLRMEDFADAKNPFQPITPTHLQEVSANPLPYISLQGKPDPALERIFKKNNNTPKKK